MGKKKKKDKPRQKASRKQVTSKQTYKEKKTRIIDIPPELKSQIMAEAPKKYKVLTMNKLAQTYNIRVCKAKELLGEMVKNKLITEYASYPKLKLYVPVEKK